MGYLHEAGSLNYMTIMLGLKTFLKRTKPFCWVIIMNLFSMQIKTGHFVEQFR